MDSVLVTEEQYISEFLIARVATFMNLPENKFVIALVTGCCKNTENRKIANFVVY